MEKEIIIAGFGGQGVLLIGKMLAYAGMMEGKEVSWLPSYGPEMRGGTANCTVVISDKPVGSPVVKSPDILVVLNRPSLDKFEPYVKKNGLLIVNSSLIDRKSERDDIDVLYVPANDVAIKCGSPKAANMVALGALIGKTELLKIESLEETIKETFSEKEKIVNLNLKALQEGLKIGKGK
ncbi:MAG: 2-oxoacid:acceptor oxidoreductase family protein [Thermoanaerobaculia bacterium]